MSNDTQEKKDSNDSNIDKNKPLLKEIERGIINYYEWNKALQEKLNQKINSDQTEKLYVINKDFLDEWKSILMYDQLKNELNSKQDKDDNKENRKMCC